MSERQTMRIAMPAWEIGRAGSGLGVKIGGLGVIVEELPPELVKAAAGQDIELEVEILTPCFAHYDKSELTRLEIRVPVTLAGQRFEFEVYEKVFDDGQKVVYFWDDWQLGWTNASAVYPDDPRMGLELYAVLNQAMAGYIRENDFDTVHLHDYHVGLIPLYLGDDYLRSVPVHFTIHNGTYQGISPTSGNGPGLLNRVGLPGERLFHKYFEFHGHLNLMKACLLKVHESGGKITTVSGDVAGTWGYAAELKRTHSELLFEAYVQKGSPPGEVFVPNRHLGLFEVLPIAGITNGMSSRNRAENLPELKAEVLRKIQAKKGSRPIFRHPIVQEEMLARDHNFSAEELADKVELKRLLHLETFGGEPVNNPILMTVVGRLVAQKNLGLVADVVERTLACDPGVKFIVLASAPAGDSRGQADEARFAQLASSYTDRVYFNSSFNLPLSKLIFAGGDFSLIPSRFEPCGLVDYESSLLGNIVIGRATGGLTKVSRCAYLYKWLDVSDRAGEADAFFDKIREAIGTFRHDQGRHARLVEVAVDIDASWDTSARQYVDLYRYGLLVKKWRRQRKRLVDRFVASLGDDRALFSEFFIPGRGRHGEALEWDLKEALSSAGENAGPMVSRAAT